MQVYGIGYTDPNALSTPLSTPSSLSLSPSQLDAAETGELLNFGFWGEIFTNCVRHRAPSARLAER